MANLAGDPYTTGFSFRDPYIIMQGKKRFLHGMSDSEKLFWWNISNSLGGVTAGFNVSLTVFSSDFNYTNAAESALVMTEYLYHHEREFYDRYLYLMVGKT